MRKSKHLLADTFIQNKDKKLTSELVVIQTAAQK